MNDLGQPYVCVCSAIRCDAMFYFYLDDFEMIINPKQIKVYLYINNKTFFFKF